MAAASAMSYRLVLLVAFAVLGGFLFGYDTGVVSGASVYVQRDLGLTDGEVEAFVSITVGFAALGAVCGSVVPLLFDYMGLDAATVAPPAVTTLIDALGIVIYLTVAQLVLDVAPHDHGGAAAATAAVHNVIEDVAQAAGAAAAGEL